MSVIKKNGLFYLQHDGEEVCLFVEEFESWEKTFNIFIGVLNGTKYIILPPMRTKPRFIKLLMKAENVEKELIMLLNREGVIIATDEKDIYKIENGHISKYEKPADVFKKGEIGYIFPQDLMKNIVGRKRPLLYSLLGSWMNYAHKILVVEGEFFFKEKVLLTPKGWKNIKKIYLCKKRNVGKWWVVLYGSGKKMTAVEVPPNLYYLLFLGMPTLDEDEFLKMLKVERNQIRKIRVFETN